jgi:hypothetical protein
VSQGSGRYQRSASGMVGAMIVTVLVIIAFVGFRALNRDDLSVDPQSVDYLQAVEALQEGNDLDPAYPVKLPAGWIATRAVFSADNLAWELDVLTDQKKYIGVRQAAMSEKDLVRKYVDEKGLRSAEITLPGAVSPTWQSWTVDNDDTAYTTTLGESGESGGEHLMVFGAAGAAEVKAFAASLVVG